MSDLINNILRASNIINNTRRGSSSYIVVSSKVAEQLEELFYDNIIKDRDDFIDELLNDE